MNDQPVFKQIMSYVDQLHSDIGQLTLLIERLMEESDLESLPRAGSKAYYGGLTTNFSRPKGWRVTYLSRCYVPVDEDNYEWSVFYCIYLSADTVFDFPPIICGRMDHESLSETQIYNRVFLTDPITSLIRKKSSWKGIRHERGWTLAQPDFDTPTKQVKGYVLNLFDMTGRQQVIDNILKPLTTFEDELSLDSMLTVSKSSIQRYIASLSDDKLRAVDEAIHFALGLET